MQVGKFLEVSETDPEMAKWANHPFEFDDKYNLISEPAPQEEEKSSEPQSGIKVQVVSNDEEEEKKSDSEVDQEEVHEPSMQVSDPSPKFEDIGIQAFESKEKSMMPVFVDQAIGTDEVEEEEKVSGFKPINFMKKAASFIPAVTEDAACQYSEMPSVHVAFEEPHEEVKSSQMAKTRKVYKILQDGDQAPVKTGPASRTRGERKRKREAEKDQ